MENQKKKDIENRFDNLCEHVFFEYFKHSIDFLHCKGFQRETKAS